MPGRDRTGPAGAGPMTGGGWGGCRRRGAICGTGWGFSRGRRFAAGRRGDTSWLRGGAWLASRAAPAESDVRPAMPMSEAAVPDGQEELRLRLDTIEDQLAAIRDQLAAEEGS